MTYKKLKNRISLLLGIFILLHLSACTGTKFLEEGQILYKGSKLEFMAPDSILHQGNLKSALNKKLVPKPNKKLLGVFKTRVWLYSKINTKKQKGFKYWLQNKIGEAPVLISDIEIDQKRKILAKVMQDNGYFNCEVTNTIEEKKRAGTIHYFIDNGPPTYINKFLLPENQSELDSLFKSYENYKVRANETYNLENIETDRTELANYVRSKGYFDFDKGDLIYLVDTSALNNKFDIKLVVKLPNDSSFHQKYYIKNVLIFPSYIDNDTNYFRQSVYKNFQFKDNYRFITNRVVSENVFIEPGQIFSFKDYQLTTSRLVNLGIYKFVNIDYQKVDKDSLNVSIRLSPTQFQNFKTSVELSTSTLGYLGSSLSIAYSNRNTARKAMELTLKASAGTEFQFTNRKAELSVLDLKFGFSLSIPRRMRFSPEKLKTKSKPITSFSLTENYQIWLQYYTINDLNLGMTYKWENRIPNEGDNKLLISHELSPFNLSWLNLISTTSKFDSLVANNSQLRSSFENNFILGSKYEITINTKKENLQRNYFILQNKVESSGNLFYLIRKAIEPKKQGEFEILSIPFSQFLHFNVDTRNYWDINEKTKLISRIEAGIGISYGNSSILPYSRQFFMGGPSTIRAFALRSLGPGTYKNIDDNNSIDQTGEFKLLFNAEYRWTFYKFIKGATFIDAGNVWLIRDDTNRPGGLFTAKNFMKQLGVGTGLGLRLDFSFIAIRLDLGIPIYKPYEDDGHKWIHQFPSDNFKDWRKDNWVWNFAIGYPF